jgi:hypothetical protein
MIMKWPTLPSEPGERRKLIVLLVSATAAIAVGFIIVPTDLGGRLITRAGYYYILTVFIAWLFFAWRVAISGRFYWRTWFRQNPWTILFLLIATAFAVWTDSFAHKLLMDDYVVQGTAWHMHATKEVGTPIRAYDYEGTWLAINTFLDKRPYFFPFLISLLHDLTGFRLANVYALNVALAFVVLACVFGLVRALTRQQRPAYIAVGLLATLPLFGQNATGASMELLSVAMMALLLVTATCFLREPSPDRLSLLVTGTVLLAQTRYESVLFVVPVCVVIVLAWFHNGRVFVSWPAVIAPLLLVPYAWHNRFLSANKYLWQLREGEDSRFALQYLAGNLEGARKFLLSTSPVQPNSVWLVLVGAAGSAWAIACLFRNPAKWRMLYGSPAISTTFLFGLAIVANLALLMFYYWSRLDEPVTARFALPLFVLLSIIAGWFMHSLELRRIPAALIVAIGLGGWLLVIGAPAYAQRIYTTSNHIMHELEWEFDQIERRPGPVFLITSKGTLPFLLQKIPVLNFEIARRRMPQIAWHMNRGTFREVLVSQMIRPSSPDGDPVVDPDDELPASFELQTLAVKRFGARWVRISRLVGVEAIEAEAVGIESPAAK